MNHRKLDLHFTETAGTDMPSAIASIRRIDAGLSAWSSRSTLYFSERMAIGLARSKAPGTVAGPEAVASAHTISIVTRGVYRLHVGETSAVIDATTAALLNAGDRCRVSHPRAVGDESIFLQFSEETVKDHLQMHGAATDATRFALPSAPISANAFIAIRSLLVHLQRDAGLGGLGCQLVEETALTVLDDLIVSSLKRSARERPSVRPETSAMHARLSEETKVLLASAPKARLTIADIAAELACSPYHLCRVFRSCTGQPVHKYLNTLRLRLALDRLCEPKQDLGGVAEDLGFASHSHFCDSFKREFGVSPSMMRNRLNDVNALVAAPR